MLDLIQFVHYADGSTQLVAITRGLPPLTCMRMAEDLAVTRQPPPKAEFTFACAHPADLMNPDNWVHSKRTVLFRGVRSDPAILRPSNYSL